MPEEPPTPPPETPPRQNVGTAFSGETTGSVPSIPTGDETVLMGSNPGAKTEVIGDFEVLGKLGQGGMGAVYRARQRSLDRQVALKILPATLEADADFVSRFQREARVAANLNHGNLVKVYASGQADGCHFIAMELVEGETLGQWLKRGALPPPEALRICADVARALEHGWNRAQLIHRDIKPGNIFLSIHGDVKVGDLGLAKSMSGDTTGLTQTGTAMGTPHYISPEQARGESDLDFRADIYSLGCTLYQMLTGRTPYTGSDPLVVMGLHRDAPPPAILKVLPSCPIPLARLVGKMLKKNKRERQTSYAELIAEIERARSIFAPATSVLEATLPPDPDATQLDTPGYTPRSATPVTAPLARTTPPVAAAKSKSTLYGGLASGVVVLGIVAFLVWPKEEKLTKAQLYAKQREAEQAAKVTTPPDLSRRPAASEPPPIKLYDTPAKVASLGGAGVTWEKNALRLDKRGAGLPPPGLRDLALRVSVLMNPDARSVNLMLRHNYDTDRKNNSYTLRVGTSTSTLQLAAVAAETGRDLATWKLPRTYGPNEWLRLEFRAVGDELTVSADGKVLGSVRDTTFPGPGTLQLFAVANGYFRDIEYVPLDGVPSGTASTAEPWQEVLRDPAKLELSGKVERTPEGLRFTGDGRSYLREGLRPRDGAVRMRATFGGCRVDLRARMDVAVGSYRLSANDDSSIILLRLHRASAQNVLLKKFDLRKPLQEGQDFELELRVVGQTLTAKLDGEVLGSVEDGTYAGGHFAVACSDVNRAPTVVKSLEVLDLDRPLAASAAPTAESWVDMLADPAKLELAGGAERTTQGVTFKQFAWALRRGPPQRDGAVRLRTTFQGVEPQLRVRQSDGLGHYQLFVKDENSVLFVSLDAPSRKGTATRFPLSAPLRKGESYELELRAVGPTFTARLNGQTLAVITDSTFTEGRVGAALSTDSPTPVSIQSLEILDLDAPAASASPTAEPWQDVLRNPAALGLSGGVERVPDGILFKGAASAHRRPEEGPNRDGAIRMRAVFSGVRVQLRARLNDATGRYAVRSDQPVGLYVFGTRGDRNVVLQRFDNATQKSTDLQIFPLATPLTEGQEYELELRAIGPALTAKFNGAVLGTVTDGTYPTGRFGVGTGLASADATATLVKAVGILDLDEPAASASPTAEPWQDVLADRSRFPGVRTVRNGDHDTMNGPIQLAPSTARNGAMRARFILGKPGSAKMLRGVGDGTTEYYEIVFDPDGQSVILHHRDAGAVAQLGKWRLPESQPLTDPRELEVRCVGGIFTVKVEGSVVGSVTVVDLPSGVFKFQADPSARVLSVGYLDLNGPAGAIPTGSPAATKDAPFVNGLGMKFVPVPITGGPTSGQRVLFSIWETRVQDYAAFAAETKREWKDPSVANRPPTNPVVKVDLEGARAFAEWLTERERRAGRIGANERYRLPRDREWSCAVGIGDREDPAQSPGELSQLLPGVYPWGGNWPPPPGAGNYAGEEAAIVLSDGKPFSNGQIPGYRDDFATVHAPVGSFAPNALGLYDLSGNVWERCDDLVGMNKKDEYVTRGGSYNNSDPDALRSARRGLNRADDVNFSTGFRLVLAPVESNASGPSAVTPAAATKEAPFANGLGMKFVPVPITGGPTGGKRVLFSIWETRVRDYEVFAKDTKGEWPAAGFEQGPTHPAVKVSWDDAQAFCAWLTARERKAGQLGANEAYRLPSDHEWSCAVGLGEREDPAKTPGEKSPKIAGVYPWGTKWPPPKNVGNFHPTLDADEFKDTSPVGSFAPNVFGLYDIGGNVWEACEDWHTKGERRVSRGGSWKNDDQSLRSANRGGGPPDVRQANNGFRAVLAPTP